MSTWQTPNKAVQQYGADIFRALMQFFEGMTDAIGDLTAHVLTAHDFYDRYAWQAAQRMVTGRLQDNARSWRSAARQSMKSSQLHKTLVGELQGPVGVRVRQLITYNAELISSLPKDVAQRVAQEIAVQQQGGQRSPVSIASMLKHVSRTRAALIARTETSKATTALTRARAEDLGISWYVWRSSEDARVRLSHRKMNGVVVSWSEPPAPERLVGEISTAGNYNAGNVWNCRCYPEPLLQLNQVTWPHRVFAGGRLGYATLAAFRRVANIEQPVAA